MPDESASFQRIEDQEIDETAPWADDVLKREDAAKILGRVIRSVERSHVIAINGTFGTGKTFFVKRLIQQFRNDGLAAVYFNAWEQDTQGEPLIAFVGELLDQLESNYGIERQSKGMKALATAAGSFALRRLVPGALRMATAGAIGEDELKELGQVGKELIGGTGAAAEAMISSYSNAQDALNQFKTELEKAAKDAIGRTNGNAVYVFIDELDRCRPTFAVEILEHIKHLFSVPGLVFVLSIDRGHLKSSISSIYGQGIDADGYLARFIDLNYKLPKPTPNAYVHRLVNHFGLKDFASRKQHGEANLRALADIFSEMSDIYGLDLRRQDQAFAELNFILRSDSITLSTFSPLVGHLAAIRAVDRVFYEEYCSGLINRKSLHSFLQSYPKGETWLSNPKNLSKYAWLIVGLYSDLSVIRNEVQLISDKYNIESPGAKQATLKLELELLEKTFEVGNRINRLTNLLEGYHGSTLGQHLGKHFDLATDFDA